MKYKLIRSWAPEIIVIIIFCILFVYMEINVNHPLEGDWYCEETGQTIQINSYFDEGGNHFTFYGEGVGHNIWSYDYDIFSKELNIAGYDRMNYSDTFHSFIVKLRAEVIDGKLYFDFIDSSDGKIRFDDMVLINKFN